MEDRRIADYFVVAGLPTDGPLEPLDDTTLSESGNLKASHGQAPITDISVMFPSLGEIKPEGWEVITKTQTGLSADLNHGSIRTAECFLCIRRGRDKPPLVDIGIMYEGKEWLMSDAEVVKESVGKHVANVNNSTSQTFITYRRGQATMPCNALVVTDICVVIASKGESPPHAFCCIQKNLNKGLMGSDVFLCYKKSMNRAKLLTYKPAVISRYPTMDIANFPFPNSVPLFCLPMGATLELWPIEATKPRPVFSTFVLTVSDAKHKVYGFAVTFYEKYPQDKLTDEQKQQILGHSDNNDDVDSLEKFTLNANKSICLLSHFPFSLDFQEWLMFLHTAVQSGVPQAVPVERYISQLLYEIPFPSPRILLQLPSKTSRRVILTQPEDLPLPRNAASFKNLLLNLGSDNCLLILLLALTEQKILIHSLRPDTLTSVAEAVATLLFPFKWQCPYIPLCPLGLVEVLHAPLPFLIGVDSRFFDLYEPPTDVSCIDLDTNIITVPDAHKHILTTKLLPKKPAKLLKCTLDHLYYQIQNNPIDGANNNSSGKIIGDDIELELQQRRKELAQELEIQEAFLKFMVHTLKGYRSYLLPITKAPTVGTTDPQALFQLQDFLKSRDKSHHKFFHLLINTQMFIRFIEERSFVADGDQGLAFFDECIEKLSSLENSVENNFGGFGSGGNCVDFRLIELDLHRNDRTVFVLPPEPPTPGCDQTYTYDKGFELNPDLLVCSASFNNDKKRHLPAFNQNNYQNGPMPGSPMARRTKHEIKSAQKLAKKCYSSPELWARLLSGTCHTLYFMVLPSMLSLNEGKEKAILQQAYELLLRATRQRLACDEVCYRLMMQLCSEHSRPLLAVKLLLLMKKFGIQLNALTYGLYNRCVLEAEWPTQNTSSTIKWRKLSNVIFAVTYLKLAVKQRELTNNQIKQISASTEGLLDINDRAMSRLSLDSGHDNYSTPSNTFMDTMKKIGNIVRGSFNNNNNSNSNTNINNMDVEATVEQVDGDNSKKMTDDTSSNVDCDQKNGEGGGSGGEDVNGGGNCRVLSRSESAGDANIIDKIQNKKCKRTLEFQQKKDGDTDQNGGGGGDNDVDNSRLPSPRQQVTENDPLGALIQPNLLDDQTKDDNKQQQKSSDVLENHKSNNFIGDLCDEPVLFKSRPTINRSATFEGSPPSTSNLTRGSRKSETLPASASVASSLANLGNSFKMGFGRYSPSRFSLRKPDLKVPHQLIENALTTISPNLTTKKSNELLQGGLSSIKSAASSMVKKLDEIKEAISTNSTPVKALTYNNDGIANQQQNHVTLTHCNNLNLNGMQNEPADGSTTTTTTTTNSALDIGGSCDTLLSVDDGAGGIRRLSSELGSCLIELNDKLPDCPYSLPNFDDKPESELVMTLTSCSQCHNCLTLLYDEDIMANWSAEDSNLNTVCYVCNKPTVPFLTITITDNQQSNDSTQKKLEPFSIPYLCPLVLRKELENILLQEGDLSVSDAKFVNEHPIIYWNLVWAFERINVQTHLPNLYLKSCQSVEENSKVDKYVVKDDNDKVVDEKQAVSNLMTPVEEGTDPLTLELAALDAAFNTNKNKEDKGEQEKLAAQVNVRCLWDEPRLHNGTPPPMYILWKLRGHLHTSATSNFNNLKNSQRKLITEQVMQRIIYLVRQNDLQEPLKILANERQQFLTSNINNATIDDATDTKSIPPPPQSIYRDVLFLACKALGRDVIHLNNFDKQYLNAFTRVTERNTNTSHMYRSQDRPITKCALYCRQYFRPLNLP